MKKFLKENFVTIVLVIVLLMFVKSCGDSQRLTRMEKQYKIEYEENVKRYGDLKNYQDSIYNILRIDFRNYGQDLLKSSNKEQKFYIQLPKEEKNN